MQYYPILMTLTKLLETVHRVELRTKLLVNDTMAGAYLSHFKRRGKDSVVQTLLILRTQHPVKLRRGICI